MIVPLLAAIVRPDNLDREVSAISASALLTRSPYALIDPARAAAAHHLQQVNAPLWIVMVLLQIGVLAWFWNAGWSARLRDRLRAVVRTEFWVRFAFGATLAAVDKLAALIPQVVQYRMTAIVQLSIEPARVWLAGWLEGAVAAMIVAGLMAAAILWLADRTHQWYLYTIAGIMGITLLVAYVAPFVSTAYAYRTPHLSPLLQSDVAVLRAKTGMTVPIVAKIVSSYSRVGGVTVEGWGGSQRIAIADTTLAGATEPELRFAIARSFGWVQANSGLHLALVEGALFVLGAAFAVFIADRIGFRRDDDPVSRLAFVGALLGCLYLVALPFYNAYSRSLDLEADAYAVTLTGDRASGVRLIVRGTDQGLLPICGGRLTDWYLMQHPTSGERIAALQGLPDPCLTQRP